MMHKYTYQFFISNL